MKTKLKSILAAALCAVGLSAFAGEPEAVQLWAGGPYWATSNLGTSEVTEHPEYGALYKFDDADSAVKSILGEEWRVPSTNDFAKLLDTSYCTKAWDSTKEGYTFTGATDGYEDKSIFLPAAGCDVGFGHGRESAESEGDYWSSTDYYGVLGWTLSFVAEDDAQVKFYSPSYGFSVRAVRDTPPTPPEAEISAVSAEGWLDLTVGDRVAEVPEELVVVDPAWGEAASATVDFTFGASTVETRTYTCASNDLWGTTTLTPGRYTLALTAGATNETAAFWKTGADWVVLDLPPYSTEGIEFQADTTYLALGQYEFAPDKTLTVLDGAKFEYAPGAGFKGGKLEMTKRYGTNVVEGGLFQIVEKIKGCADNPWEVGVGVEAYTNGTELVFVGRGTIADLSEIPAGIKTGITKITLNAGVTDAAAGVFYGFGSEDAKVAVTLPDNWQGELPDNHGNWHGAKGATLTRMPMAVRQVKVQQRYPWNGKVDVDFDLTGEGDVKVTLSARVDGKKIKNPTVTGETTFDLGTGGELKDLRLTWDAKADFGDEEKHEKIKVKLTVEKAEAN